jgi:hypothetical protein
MSKVINVADVVKDIPKCDFIIGNSSWEKLTKTALSGAQALHCIEQDINRDYLDRYVIAEKLKYRTMWNGLKRQNDGVEEGDGKDFWELPADNLDDPTIFMCKAKFEMRAEDITRLKSAFILASNIVWNTLSPQLQEKLGADWFEANKEHTKLLWDKIKTELNAPDAWSKIINKQTMREITILPGESPDDYLVRSKELIEDGISSGAITAKDGPWEILGGLVGKEWNDVIRTFRGMKEEEVTMTKVTQILSTPRKRKSPHDTKINFVDDELEDEGGQPPVKKPRREQTGGGTGKGTMVVAGGVSGNIGACSFCSRPRHTADICWINPESKSFRLEEMKKILARPAASKRMKAIQQLLKSAKYQKVAAMRTNYGSFPFNNDSDSDDEGALEFSSCGLNAYAV